MVERVITIKLSEIKQAGLNDHRDNNLYKKHHLGLPRVSSLGSAHQLSPLLYLNDQCKITVTITRIIINNFYQKLLRYSLMFKVASMLCACKPRLNVITDILEKRNGMHARRYFSSD